MPPGMGYAKSALNIARGKYGAIAAGAAIGGTWGAASGMWRDDRSVVGGAMGGALKGAMLGAMVPAAKGAMAGWAGARAGGVSPWMPAVTTAMHRMKLDARFSFANARIGANKGFAGIKAAGAAISGRWAASKAARTSGGMAAGRKLKNGIPNPLRNRVPYKMKRRPFGGIHTDGGHRRPGGFSPSSAF